MAAATVFVALVLGALFNPVKNLPWLVGGGTAQQAALPGSEKASAAAARD
jgi:hypothetical protein